MRLNTLSVIWKNIHQHFKEKFLAIRGRNYRPFFMRKIRRIEMSGKEKRSRSNQSIKIAGKEYELFLGFDLFVN